MIIHLRGIMLIYFAGPLFSEAERQFNEQLTQKLEALGFNVFLPQRDGVEQDKPPYSTMTVEERQMAIFHLDKSKILVSDIFLCVLDGRVPDEGACVELGIAYCQKDLQRRTNYLLGFKQKGQPAFPASRPKPCLLGAF